MDTLLAPDDLEELKQKKKKQQKNENFDNKYDKPSVLIDKFILPESLLKTSDVLSCLSSQETYPVYLYRAIAQHQHQQHTQRLQKYTQSDFNNWDAEMATLTQSCEKSVQPALELTKTESDSIDIENWQQTFSKIMARSYKNHYYSLNTNQVSSTETKSNGQKANKNSKHLKADKFE
jgi:hypothetical protein